jgi:RNA polymerase sigma factor (TIGR02999 family)
VHEVYLKLMGGWSGREGGSGGAGAPAAATPEAGGTFVNRAHFFAAAGEAMRRILVDQARRRRALKRGGGLGKAEMPAEVAAAGEGRESVDVLALNEALVRLEGEDARMATIVKLRFFAEMTVDEVATALELSRRTVLRDWIAAKAWLMEALGDGGHGAGDER